MLTRDVPMITLTDTEAILAREAITAHICRNASYSTDARLRGAQLVLCINQRLEKATARYWSAPARCWRLVKRAWRAVRQCVRNVRAWTWRHTSERVAGTALFIIAALVLLWALYR